jgi:Protein-disulfide isomerase
MSQNSHNVFTSFLKLLRIRHNNAFSNKYFNEHPHKHNLFGLSKMLSEYNIENVGTKIKNKEQDLFNIELPFIAHCGGEFVAVYKVEQEKVHYIRDGKRIIIPVSQFIQAWSGIILLTEVSSNSIEPDYDKHRIKELLTFAQKLILIVAGIVALGITYVSKSLFSNIGTTLLLTVNLVGVYVGYLLILKQMSIHSTYADKICSLFSKGDCNNVLESEAAKLWGVFGWSEIGLGYFVANVLIFLFLPHLIPYLALINILALPYTVWSVWYQKVKAKQWCPLCLIVQALLWIVFILNVVFGNIYFPELCLQDILITGCVYAIPMFALNLLVPALSEGNQVEQLKQEINSIKANEDVFKALSAKQPHYEVTLEDSHILFGNPKADLLITILTNPFCNPCAKMHKRVEEYLKMAHDKVCVQYIFSSFGADLDFANKYLIAAYHEKEQDEFERIISNWFEKGKILKETFFDNMQLDIKSFDVEAEFQQHENWKTKTQLRATPTILVNGYKLPNNYKIEDLRYFTDLKIDIN